MIKTIPQQLDRMTSSDLAFIADLRLYVYQRAMSHYDMSTLAHPFTLLYQKGSGFITLSECIAQLPWSEWDKRTSLEDALCRLMQTLICCDERDQQLAQSYFLEEFERWLALTPQRYSA